MGSVDESGASVRIELADSGDAPTTAAPTGGSPTPRWPLALLVLGAVAAFVALLALRPDEGSTAAGTPITAPTTTAAVSTTSVGASTAAESDEEEGVPSTIAPSYETAELSFFPFEIVRAEIGWFALGFDLETNVGALYRSIDGLDWRPLPTSSTPPGDLLGFARVEAGYVAAVDELGSWTGGGEFEDAEHHITFWESSDGIDWLRSVERTEVRGIGFPYPALISDWGSAVPVLRVADSQNLDALVDYLAPAIDDETARLVCSTSSTVNADSIDLLGCDDEVLASIPIGEVEELWDDQYQLRYCVDLLRDEIQQQNVVRFAAVGGEVENVGLGQSFAVFGALVGDQYFVIENQFGGGPETQCLFGDGRASGPGSADARLLTWSPETEERTIALPGRASFDGFRSIVPHPSGDLLYVGDSELWRASPPFEEWQAVSFGPTRNSFDTTGISIAKDASVILARVDGRWALWRAGEVDPVVDRVAGVSFGQLLLVTDDFAIIMMQDSEFSIMKVPLS